MESRFKVRKVLSQTHQRPDVEIQINNNPQGYVNTGYLPDNLEVSSNASDTDRKKSFVHHTREALPRLDNYRNDFQALKRPSIGELHGEEKDVKDLNENLTAGSGGGQGGHGVKLGWIQGVLIPCLLNIWGVMLFLRLAWVVGQAGIGETLLIIAISAVVCVITTTSMSAICTNGEVQGGGIYYIISRSLGPEFGASVGIVFAFANAVAASMNTIGFCLSLNDLLKENGLKIVDNGLNDVRIAGTIALLVMIFICAVGMEWESKAQNLLIVIIVAAMVDFIVGACVGPENNLQIAQGFYGLSTTIFSENWGSSYKFSEGQDQNFFSVFAIFFPSVTGIQAGANISGDLKNPAYSIPNGTMLSLLISMASYAIFVVVAGGAAFREASGIESEVASGNYTDCFNRTCEYGLANSYTVMQMMSSWGPLIYAGCFAATLSTALTNLLSVPRLIQAIGYDRIYPGLIFFSKGYGKNNEAYRGYVLTFLISVAFLLIAELNAIAPLITNFYLASYALINFCTFHAALIKPLGWRPTYKYYNTWVSLLGFVVCVGIMFLIDWVTSLVTMIVIFALYLLVLYRKPDVNWGSSTQAQTYKTALSSALKLSTVSEHVKNYRPQILVLSGKPCARPPLLDLAYLITKNNALMICGDISQKKLSYKSRQRLIRSSYEWLKDRKIKAFYSILDNVDFESGSKSLLQAVGVGKLRPNVMMMGYKENWMECPVDELESYFTVLHEAFTNRLGVTILRVHGGLDFSKITDEEELTKSHSCNDLPTLTKNHSKLESSDSSLTITSIRGTDKNSLGFLPIESPYLSRRYIINEKKGEKDPKDILKANKKKALADQIRENTLSQTGQEVPPNVLQTITLFERKQIKGTIDVWWLYDDGGLTILLPYIIRTRNNWSSCKLRIFALANRKQELELEERNMASLLSKFRIDYADLKMVEDVTAKPKQETLNYFDNIIKPFKENGGSNTTLSPDSKITDAELDALKDKTYRQLRLRELLHEHSKDATLVVMSLPMPRKGMVSAPLYMAWLEVITSDLPPVMLVRGNQTSVLTFYS